MRKPHKMVSCGNATEKVNFECTQQVIYDDFDDDMMMFHLFCVHVEVNSILQHIKCSEKLKRVLIREGKMSVYVLQNTEKYLNKMTEINRNMDTKYINFWSLAFGANDFNHIIALKI